MKRSLHTLKDRRRSGGELHLAEMTPGFCHYLRFINETPLLEVPDKRKMHHYTRIEEEIATGVLEGFSVDSTGKRHTFTLREGLQWSDGKIVTTEDVRYALEDVLLNPKFRKYLTNSENAEIMLPEWEWIQWGEKQVVLHVLDKRKFMLEFSSPCFGFVQMQVRSARWQMFIKPSHYLKQFHERYAKKEELLEKMEQNGYKEGQWSEFYYSMDPFVREAGYFVPERIRNIWNYPSLDPWIYEEGSKKEHYILKKNPYFYMFDQEGERLPYLEKITRDYYPTKDLLDKALLTGEYDLSGCFLKRNDSVLEDERILKCYDKFLLAPWQVQQVVFLINLCPADEWIRPYVQDIRFRMALSLALDRRKMKEQIFEGDGEVSQAAPAKYRPYYKEEFKTKNSEYDLCLAGKLLDEMGILYKTKESVVRIFPDGHEAVMEMIYYMVTPMADEAVAFFKESLARIGIRLKVKKLQNGSKMGEYQVRNRHIFTVWEMPGDDPFIPYQIGGLSDPCPLYWKWYETNGEGGEEPIEAVKALYKFRDMLKMAKTQQERNKLAEKIYELQSENIFVLGTVSGVRQPFLLRKGLKAEILENKDTLYSVLSGAKTWYMEMNEK